MGVLRNDPEDDSQASATVGSTSLPDDQHNDSLAQRLCLASLLVTGCLLFPISWCSHPLLILPAFPSLCLLLWVCLSSFFTPYLLPLFPFLPSSTSFSSGHHFLLLPTPSLTPAPRAGLHQFCDFFFTLAYTISTQLGI